MIKLNATEYATIMSMMYATSHLIDYINKDVIKYNELNMRMNRVTELITKIENDEK